MPPKTVEGFVISFNRAGAKGWYNGHVPNKLADDVRRATIFDNAQEADGAMLVEKLDDVKIQRLSIRIEDGL